MPFKFVHLCDLLAKLEELNIQDPPQLPAKLRDLTRTAIELWFRSHRKSIDASDTDGVALLSALFPERRTDRVFCLKEKSLTKVLGRVLCLGVYRRRLLDRWTEKGAGDLGACVERVQQQTEMKLQSQGNEVTVEEIDRALAEIAAGCRFSSPKVREAAPIALADVPEKILKPIFHRLQSREAKWLTRIILRDYPPVILDEGLVLRNFHFLLPDLLKFQSSFDAAIRSLRGPIIGTYRALPGKSMEGILKDHAARCLKPIIGVKVGRVDFLKARSIKHCAQMAGSRHMSLERKYDGEYCQIHIDLEKGSDWLQIFSKSGKDSTKDKKAIQGTLHKCLKIGRANRRFATKCILEGELVVFSDKESKILEFHKLRKHVSRSGSFLGTEQDSQPHDFEHLMIVFFDLMLIDNDPVMTKNFTDRRRLLEELVEATPGRAVLATQEEIQISSPSGQEQLKRYLAAAIRDRWEGYVLKPCHEPYFGFNENTSREYAGCWIKLKKDYIRGLGDTADFAIVGASYNSKEALTLGLKNLSWTSFHVGCLENKADVLRFDAKPRFRIIDALNQSIQKHDMKALNQLGQFVSVPYSDINTFEEYDLRIDAVGLPKMDVVFCKPFVFEIMGGGFDKPPNRAYYTLRFPRVLKIHWDRGYKDAVGFDEMQQMAVEARTSCMDLASPEDVAWIEKLERADASKKNTKALLSNSSVQIGSHPSPTSVNKQFSSPRRVRNSPKVPLIRVDTVELDLQGAHSQGKNTVIDSDELQIRTPSRLLPTPPSSSPPDRPSTSYLAERQILQPSATASGAVKRKMGDSPKHSKGMPPLKKHISGAKDHLSADSSFRSSLAVLSPFFTPDSLTASGQPSALAYTFLTSPTQTSAPALAAIPSAITTVPQPYTALAANSPSSLNTRAHPVLPTTSPQPQTDHANPVAEATKRKKQRGYHRPRKQSKEMTSATLPETTFARVLPPPHPASTHAQAPAGASSAPSTSAVASTTPPLHPVNSDFRRGSRICATSTKPSSLEAERFKIPVCATSNLSILLTPDVAAIPHVTQLLRAHGASYITHTVIWSRNLPPHLNPLEPTTGSAKQKVVLFDTRGPPLPCALALREVMQLALREKVLFYDWRMLEQLVVMEKHGVEEKDWKVWDGWKNFYGGKLFWDEGLGKVVREGWEATKKEGWMF
ncbi:MAG: hypothetical protein M1827_000302 [Pycnora praestabilis]|nr:MAG: hypothetical protein M1827_000302 [Pycnora praestabilis]